MRVDGEADAVGNEEKEVGGIRRVENYIANSS